MSLGLRAIGLFVAFVAALAAGFQPAASQFAQGGPAPGLQQARFAFVVGADGYEGAELPTAANDAALLADAFKTAGFEVAGARNLDQDTFRAAFREFVEKVAAAGPNAVASVYVSGYGVQSDGENYLIPPGASVQRESDLALNAIRLSDLTRALAGLPARGRVVVFDVAHAPPFARDWGLAPGLALVEPEAGTLVAFNAAPGAIAPAAQPPYGPYALALAEALREPGLPIDEAFARARLRVAELTKGAQAPWSASRLAEPLVMLERGPDAPPPPAASAPERVAARRAQAIGSLAMEDAYSSALERDSIAGYEEFLAAYPTSPYAANVRDMLAVRREASVWRRSLALNTPEAYWTYLDRYPRGPHVGEARRRLQRLSAAPEPPRVYAVVDYPYAPPPVEEIIIIERPGPRVFVALDAPVVVYAPPPVWWRPPPPPIYVEESYYFLPAPVQVIERPIWIAPPAYVVAPPPPVYLNESRGVNPYVAIPAALAAGIVAGKLISDRRNDRDRGRDRDRDRDRDRGPPPRQPVLPAIAQPVRAVPNLPIQPRQTSPVPAVAPAQQVAPTQAPSGGQRGPQYWTQQPGQATQPAPGGQQRGPNAPALTAPSAPSPASNQLPAVSPPRPSGGQGAQTGPRAPEPPRAQPGPQPLRPQAEERRGPAPQTQPLRPQTEERRGPAPQTQPLRPQTEERRGPAPQVQPLRPQAEERRGPAPQVQPLRPQTEERRGPAPQVQPLRPQTEERRGPAPQAQPLRPQTEERRQPQMDMQRQQQMEMQRQQQMQQQRQQQMDMQRQQQMQQQRQQQMEMQRQQQMQQQRQQQRSCGGPGQPPCR